jgi:hypothetical protein
MENTTEDRLKYLKHVFVLALILIPALSGVILILLHPQGGSSNAPAFIVNSGYWMYTAIMLFVYAFAMFISYVLAESKNSFTKSLGYAIPVLLLLPIAPLLSNTIVCSDTWFCGLGLWMYLIAVGFPALIFLISQIVVRNFNTVWLKRLIYLMVLAICASVYYVYYSFPNLLYEIYLGLAFRQSVFLKRVY